MSIAAFEHLSAATVQAWAEGDQIVIRVGAHQTDLVKQVPGARYHDPSQTWRLPKTWTAWIVMHGVFAHTLEVTDDLRHWAQWFWQNHAGRLVALRVLDDLEMGGPTAARLWPLQRVATYAMFLAERYLLGDEMGGGKTRTTLAAMKLAATVHGEDAVFPALVVCPNKVRRTWVQQALEPQGDETEPFWEGLSIEVLPKTAAARRKVFARVASGETKVLVANWEALASLSRLEPFGNIEMTEKERTPQVLNETDWRTIVADEAHRAKDRRAKQTRALKAITFGTLVTGTTAARFRFALTGTPIANNSAEAWSILNFLDEQSWPAYSKFVDRYASTTWNLYGGLDIGGLKPETRDEFHACLDPMFMRRLRAQFDPFKPKVMRTTMSVPMEARQAKAYSDLAKSMLADLDGGVLTTTNPMVRGGRLTQLAQAYGEMVDKGRKDEASLPVLDLLLKTPSNKVTAMMEIVEDLGITPGGGGTPVVFGAASRQLIGLCEQALVRAKITYGLIAGGMSDHDQQVSEALFETGGAQVMLCVIDAAKEGLNSLTRAPILVFLQKSWSRVANEQFQARIDRPGQRAASIQVIDVVSEGTLEEFDQVEKLAAKYANFQEVVADERTFRQMLEYRGQQ